MEIRTAHDLHELLGYVVLRGPGGFAGAENDSAAESPLSLLSAFDIIQRAIDALYTKDRRNVLQTCLQQSLCAYQRGDHASAIQSLQRLQRLA